MISFFLKYFPCTCIFYLLTLCTLSANASPQTEDIENTENTEKTSTSKVQLSFIPEENRSNTKRLNFVISSNNASKVAYIDFDKMKPQNRFKLIKDRYLTLYSGKTEALRATYLQGSYAINYTQNW